VEPNDSTEVTEFKREGKQAGADPEIGIQLFFRRRFSNDWKTFFGFFQSLENIPLNFPIIGKIKVRRGLQIYG
jgi:hypothetical protein